MLSAIPRAIKIFRGSSPESVHSRWKHLLKRVNCRNYYYVDVRCLYCRIYFTALYPAFFLCPDHPVLDLTTSFRCPYESVDKSIKMSASLVSDPIPYHQFPVLANL